MNQPIKIVDTTSGLVLFDGLEAVVWKIMMKANIAASGVRVKNTAPGQLYTFIFVQDETGGYSFAWPSQFVNAMMVDMASNATTVQNFIGSTGGMLLADIPGAWSQE